MGPFGIFIVAVFVCARYTAESSTYHNTLPSILPQAHPKADGARPAGFTTRQANRTHMRGAVAILKKYRRSVDHYTGGD